MWEHLFATDIMTEPDQTHHFATELDALILRFRQEYDLTLAAVVGTLYVKQHELCAEIMKKNEEEEE